MGDAFETVAKAVCEVIGREDLPLGSSVVRLLLLGYPVRGKIPHLGVSTGDILLHAEERGHGLVFAVVHVLELLEVRLDVLLGVLASVSRALLAILSSTLELDLSFVAVADISLLLLDELLGKVEQLLEVVTRVSDVGGSEALQNSH